MHNRVLPLFLTLALGLTACRDVELPPQPQVATLVGALDTDGKVPAGDNALRLLHATTGARFDQQTDADGGFVFGGLQPGSYLVQADLAGFAPLREGPFVVLSGATVDLGVLHLVWLGQTQAEGSISGSVIVAGGAGGNTDGGVDGGADGGTDGGVDRPSDAMGTTVALLLERTGNLPPAKVAEATVDAFGRFTARVPPGRYTLEATHPWYVSARQSATLAEGQLLELPEPLVLQLNPAQVSGEVVLEVETLNGAPTRTTAGVTVTSDTGAVTTTDAQGRYTLTGLAAGTRRLVFTYPGFHDANPSRTLTLGAAERATYPQVKLLLDRGDLAGQVRMSDGSQLENVSVFIAGAGDGGVADGGVYTTQAVRSASEPSVGDFVLRDLPVATYNVVAQRTNYVDATSPAVTVRVGEVVRVDELRLARLQGDFLIEDPDPLNTAGFTRARAVTLVLSNVTNAAEFRVVEGTQQALASEPWQPYVTNRIPFLLSVGDGPKTVYLQVKNTMGNEGAALSATIVLDTTPPGSPSLVLASGQPFTRLANPLPVTLSALDTGGVAFVRLAAVSPDGGVAFVDDAGVPDGGFAALDAPRVPYVRDTSFQRPTSDDGVQGVVAQFIDNAGNASDLARASIVIDTLPPTGAITVLRGARATVDGFTNSLLVDLSETWGAEPNGGFVQVRLANDAQNLATAVAQPTAARASWFLDAQGEGLKTVHYVFLDAAGNAGSAGQATITYDATTPLVTATRTTPSPTSSPVVGLALTTVETSPFSPDAGLAVAESPLFTNAQVGPYVATTTYTLGAGDGPRSVFVRVRDAAGNEGTSSVSLELDTTAPTGLAVAVVGALRDGTPSSVLTHTTSVTVNLTQSGATQVLLGDETLTTCPATGTAGWRALTGTSIANHVLTGATATRTVSACFADAAGNRAGPVSTTIDFDGAAPTGCTLALTGLRADGTPSGLPRTAQRSVPFAVTCLETPTEVVLSEQATITCTAPGLLWAPLSPTSNQLTLSSVDGAKSVLGCVRDAARNVALLSAVTMTLDTTPPTGPVVSLNNGQPYVNAAALDAGVALVTVRGTATGAAEWAFAEEGTAPSTFVSYATANPAQLALSSGDGVKTVKALFRDDLGNTTPVEVSDAVEVDTAPPTLTALSLLGALADGTPSTSLTASTTVTATFTQNGGTGWYAGDGSLASCPTTGHTTLAGSTASLTLPGTGTTRTVKACVSDAAGNVSALRTATIDVDASPPANCSLVVTGLRADDGQPTSGAAAGQTGRREVRISLSGCSEVPTQLALSQSAVSCTQSANLAWAVFDGSATNTYTLTGIDGPITLAGCARDAARNLVALTNTPGITLDTTPPSGASVSLDNDSAWVNAAQKAARGGVNRASALGVVTGATEWALAEGAVPSTWRALATNNPFTFDFSSGEGLKTVRVLYRDAVGNVTASEVSDSIEFDTIAPTLSSVTITGALADGTVSTATTADLNVTATVVHSGGTRIDFGSALPFVCTDPARTWEAFSGTTVATTLGGSGSPRTLAVCITDEAGNPAAAAVSDAIAYDPTSPGGCTLAFQGRKADGTAAAASPDATALREVGFTLTNCAEPVVDIALAEAATITCSVSANLDWRPLTGTDTFTLSEVDGLKTVLGCVRDATGNVQAAPISDTITLDTTPPSAASVSIRGGAAYFNRADWLAAGSANTMSVSGAATDAVDWALAEGATPSSFSALTSRTFTFTAGEGGKTIAALFRDALGNVTPVVVTDSITVDTTPPTLTAINLSGTLADGTASDTNTSSTTVQLSLTHTDAEGLYVGDGALAACPATGYASFGGGAAATITLPGSGSARTVRACVSDVAGNTAGYQQDSITWDAAAPGSCALTLVGRRVDGTATSGATIEKTALTQVGVTLTGCTETPADVYLVEAGSAGCSATATLSWQPYVAGVSSFTLSGADGLKTVVGCVRDATRNVTALVAPNETITLDTTPPTLATVSLHAGAAYFNRAAWVAAGNLNRMNVTGTASGAAEWAWAEGATPTSFGAFSSPTTVANTFSVGDGTKTVRALFRDDVGNVTATEAQDTVEVDTDVPTLSSVTITGALADGTASTTTTATTAVNVTLAQTGGTLLAVGNSTFSCPATLAGFTAFNGTSTTTTLTDAAATRTVRACVADAAGNISGTSAASILYDATAPTSCVLTLVGRRTDGTSTAGTVPEKTALASVTASLSGCSETPADVYLLETTGVLTCPAAGSPAWQTLGGGSSLDFTMSSGDVLKTVKACVRDAARNVSAASFQDTITLDTTPPTGASVSLHGGAAYFNRAAWLAAGNLNRMNVTGTATGATEWAWAESAAPTSFGGFSSPATVANTFTTGDGTKTVRALFRDDVGNVTATEAQDTVEVDTQPPTLTSLTLVGTLGDGTTSSVITNTTAVTAQVVQSGGVTIASGDGTFTCPGSATFTAFNGSSAAVTLGGAGATRTVRVCVADAAGNATSTAEDTIDFDGVTPTGCALVLTGRRVDSVATSGPLANLTALRDVGLSLSGCSDTNVSVALTEAASVTCSNTAGLTWTTLSATSTFQLSAGDGSKSVRGCVRDAALNVGSLAEDSITLDTTPPDNASVRLNHTGGYGNTYLRTVSGSADDAIEWAVSQVSTGPFSTWLTYSTTPSTTSTTYLAPDGTKYVYARFRDALLNTTATVQASVIIDTVAPTAPVLLTVDSQNRGARLFWDPASDATSGIAAYELLSDPSGIPATLRTTTNGTATSGYVLGLENRADQVFAVRAVDNAGNRSALSGTRSTTIGWKRVTVSPGSVYPIRPLDIALRGSDIFVTYMDTDSNWSGLAGNLKVAVSHDRGETWAFKTLQSSFSAGRTLAPIRFTDDAVWVATVGNLGFASDIVAGNVAVHVSTDNGDTWADVSDSDLLLDNYGKVDSLGLLSSGSSLRVLYMLASSSATKQVNVISTSSTSSTALSPTPYLSSGFFGSAPYQVTNGLKACGGNFSSVTMWRDRSSTSTNASNLYAVTHYFAPKLDYVSGEGFGDWVTSGVGTGEEVGNFDLACTSLPETMQAYVVFDRAGAAAWAVGNNGTIMRYDDTSWTTAPSPTPRHIYSVQDVWAVGVGYSASGTNYSLILRWNGSTWEELQSTAGNGASLYDTYTNTASNVFAVGSSGTILRWNGSAWAAMTSGTANSLNGVWGSASNNVIAVGNGGTIVRYNGSVWGPMTSGTVTALRAVWGTASNNVWAVGDGGLILRYNGTTWSSVASPTASTLLSIWGSSSSDIWAVGSGGTVIRYNGSTWSTFASPAAGQTLYEVSGVSANDVWAVGTNGTAIRFNGSSWSLQPVETSQTLNSVWWGGSSGGPATTLYLSRKLGSQQYFQSTPTALRTDADRSIPPQVWAGARSVFVLYRTTGEKLQLGESSDEGANFPTWTTLEAGVNKGLWGVLSGDNSTDVAVAFTDINAATMTVMIPAVGSFPLEPLAGVGNASLTWATVPQVDRYQVDSDADGFAPWANVDFTSTTQATIPTPVGLAPYVQVRAVDEQNMPGNTGELWQLRPFSDATVNSSVSTGVGPSNNGGLVAYNDRALVWPPRGAWSSPSVYRTTNYGQTWSLYTPPSAVLNTSGPRALAGFNGRAALFHSDGTTPTTLRAQVFAELGAGAATQVTVQSGVNIDLLAAKASIDNTGLVVAYADTTNDVIRVATANSSMTFTLRPNITTTAANTIGALEVAKVDFSTGRVVITWREYSAGDPRTDTLWAIESTNSGASWSAPIQLKSGESSSSSASVDYTIGSTDLAGSNNGAYSVLARTTEFNDFRHKPANLWLTVTGTDHSSSVSGATYVDLKLDSETVDKWAFDAFGNSDGHYLAWRAESLDGTVAKLRFAYCFSDCHLFRSWDRSLLKVWSSYVKDQARFVGLTVSQTSDPATYEPTVYVMYTESTGSSRRFNVLSHGVHRRTR